MSKTPKNEKQGIEYIESGKQAQSMYGTPGESPFNVRDMPAGDSNWYRSELESSNRATANFGTVFDCLQDPQMDYTYT
jgi:hypothetical protein